MDQQAIETQHHWNWLKGVSRDLFLLDETPLLGQTHPFPWKQLSQELSKCFNIKNLSIEPGDIRIRAQSDLLNGIEKPHMVCHITSSALEGEAALVLAEADIHALMHHTLKLDAGSILSLPKDFIESFARFLQVETISCVNSLGFDKKLSFRLASKSELKVDTELCQDIWIQLEKERFLARLILQHTFHKSWQAFSFQAFGEMPSKTRLEAVPVTLHVETGRSHLKLDEWMGARAGDFLTLDHAFYEPRSLNESGTAKCLLTIGGKPLFFCELEDGNLKIIEQASHTEAYDTMVDNLNMNENMHASTPQDEEAASDDNLFEEDAEEALEDDEKEEADLFADEDMEEESDIDDDDDPFEEEFAEEDEEALQVKSADDTATDHPEKPADHHPEESNAHAVEVPRKTISASHPVKVGELTLQDIPVTITCELAQVHTTAQKLLELAPGNLLDLNLSSDSAVLLVVNGKIVGKGEIIKIGETLGVRILEIGSVE